MTVCKGIAVCAALVLAAAAQAKSSRQARITLTAHGIPHIVADDFGGLGVGYGYASAMIDLCAVNDAFLTLGGHRSSVYGAEGPSLVRTPVRAPIPNAMSDLTTRLIVDDELAARAYAGISPDLRTLVEGYAEGFNRYVAATPAAQRPEACKGDNVVRPITRDDVVRRVMGSTMLLGSRFLQQQMFAAAPPEQKQSFVPSFGWDVPVVQAGSNAIAFGRNLTSNGSGLLLGNPHFFWDGPDRFMQAHLTVPGRYDVMGASLVALPLINIGFNSSLAWSHTVSTDIRGTLYKLTLDPADATRYLIDGRSEPMTCKSITIQVRNAAGQLEPLSREFWLTKYGPVVEGPGLPWDSKTAYAFADANRENFRTLDQWLAIGSSRTVDELAQALKRIGGTPFVNTIAADSKGGVLYANMAVTPALDPPLVADCSVQSEAAMYFFANVMDGSRSACAWKHYDDAPQPGVMPASHKPILVSRDYVANSNDSHWLTNPRARLEGFSPTVGWESIPQRARTRLGHVQVAGKQRFDLRTIEAMLFANRNYPAEIVTDDLIGACRAQPVVTMPDKSTEDVSRACDILAKWDRRDDLDSIGAILFREFLPSSGLLGPAANAWRVPFDARDPVNTPRGLDTQNPKVLQALAGAVRSLKTKGWPIDAKLRDVQFVERNGRKIPLHGGPDSSVYNVIELTPKPGVGYTDPMFGGSSYIQAVTFDRNGPVADAILASSQSSDPASPYHADQTELYSKKTWVRLPFTARQIAASAIGEPITLTVTATARP